MDKFLIRKLETALENYDRGNGHDEISPLAKKFKPHSKYLDRFIDEK